MNLLLANITPMVVDVVAIAFVAIFAISGLIRGFTKLFFKVFGTLISLLLAILLCASVAQFLEEQFSLVTNLAVKLEGVLTRVFGDALMNTTLEQAVSNGLSDLGLGSLLLPIVMSFAEDSSIPTNTTLNQIICPTFAYYLVTILAVVALFIIFKILCHLVSALVKSLYSFKALAFTDRMLGLALGFISGMLYLEILLMVLGVLPLGFIQEVCAVIPATVFASFVQNVGLYGLILKSISLSDIVGFVKGIIAK